MPRVSRSGGPMRANAATEYIADAPTLKAKTPLANGALLAAESRPRRQQPFVRRLLDPEAR